MHSLPRSLLALLLGPLFACGSDNSSEDEIGDTGESTTTADGDGDGESSGDGDGDSSGDGDGDSSGDGDGDSTGDGDSSGDGDTGDAGGPCEMASDCALVDDCCSCDAVPTRDVEPCDLECMATVCDTSFGKDLVDAECKLGTCQLTPLNCDVTQITCLIPPPRDCPPGQFRSVHLDCWGACVGPTMCDELPTECDASTCPAGWACMNSQSGSSSKCIPLADECGGVAGCECIAPWLGEVCDGSCAEADGVLICEDGG